MDLRDRILEAAAKVYSETGFRGATTKKIAEQAGVNEVTIFRHFGSKTLLLHQAIRCAGFRQPVAQLPDIPIDPPRELLEWAQSNHAEIYAKRALIKKAMGEMEEQPELLPEDQNPTACSGRLLYDYLSRLKDGEWIDPDVDLDAATMMLMGTLFGDALTRDAIPAMCRHSPEESVARYVALFTKAIALKESR